MPWSRSVVVLDWVVLDQDGEWWEITGLGIHVPVRARTEDQLRGYVEDLAQKLSAPDSKYPHQVDLAIYKAGQQYDWPARRYTVEGGWS